MENCWLSTRETKLAMATQEQDNRPVNEDGTTKPVIQQEVTPLSASCVAHASKTYEKPPHTRKKTVSSLQAEIKSNEIVQVADKNR